jgi:hypothetical protein
MHSPGGTVVPEDPTVSQADPAKARTLIIFRF